MVGTKIIATVGPASDNAEGIASLLEAGTDVVRFNLKHNTPDWHRASISRVREVSRASGLPVCIIADIPGSDTIDRWLHLVTSGDIDYVALSYIRSADEVRSLAGTLGNNGGPVRLIAKIETAESLDNMEDIIASAHCIMVARGDLGVALPVEEIPYHQKHVIRRCLEAGKPVITATEMLNSMMEHPAPTRAEVSDVANAVYDSTDAVMLSGETAVGKYPREAVAMMRSITRFIDTRRPQPQIRYDIGTQTDALTIAASDLVKQRVIESQKISAFVVITETGETARSLARLRPSVPIIAVTRHVRVRNQLLLVWGVRPLLFTPSEGTKEVSISDIREVLVSTPVVESGKHVIMVYGSEVGVSGNTNVLRIEQV